MNYVEELIIKLYNKKYDKNETKICKVIQLIYPDNSYSCDEWLELDKYKKHLLKCLEILIM